MLRSKKKKQKEELELNNLQSEIDNFDNEIADMLGDYLTNDNPDDCDISVPEQDCNTDYTNSNLSNNTNGDKTDIILYRKVIRFTPKSRNTSCTVENDAVGETTEEYNNIVDSNEDTAAIEDYENIYEDSASEFGNIRRIANRGLTIVALIALVCATVAILYYDLKNYLEYMVFTEPEENTVSITTSVETALATESSDSSDNIVEGEQYVDYEDLSTDGREELKLKDPPFEITDESEEVIEESISLLKEALECDKFIADNTLALDEDKLNEFKDMYSEYNTNLTSFSSIDLDGKSYSKYATSIIEMLEVYDGYFVTMIEFSGNSASEEEYSDKIASEISRISDELGDKSWIFTEYSDIFYFYKLYE